MSEPEPPDFNRRAVALSWSGDGAPVVSAKGRGLIAEEIIRLAREADVPMHEDVHLVQALASVDLDTEIPEALYVAVAQVLAFAFEISGKHISLNPPHPDSAQKPPEPVQPATEMPSRKRRE